MKTWLLRRYVSPVTVGPEGPMADEASAAGQGTRPTNVFGQGAFQESTANKQVRHGFELLLTKNVLPVEVRDAKLAS